MSAKVQAAARGIMTSNQSLTRVVEYYAQVLAAARPLDDELVLIDLGSGRYCAFGEQVSSRAQYAHKQRAELYRKSSFQTHDPTMTMNTNRPGFDCYFVCGDEGLKFLRDCEVWHVRLVKPAPDMRPALEKLWDEIIAGHPKFGWFVPRAEPVQLRLL